MAVDGDGFVYVVDHQLSEVKKFSPDGDFIKTIARQGEGPGGLRRPDSICMSSGGLVCVSMAYPSRIVQFTKEGGPVRSILMPEDDAGRTPLIYEMAPAGDHLVIRDAIRESLRLCAVDDNGSETTRYYEEKHRFDDDHPVREEKSRGLQGRWTVGEDGKLYVATSFYDYEISVYRPTGELDLVIEREYEHRKRTLLGEGDPFRDRYYFYGDRLYVVTCFTGAIATMMSGGEENKFSSSCTDPMSVICYKIGL